MALEAMRQAEPLGPAHPLAQFISIRQDVSVHMPVGGSAALDELIFRNLARLITKRLNFLRNSVGLPPVSSRTNRTAMREDFGFENNELEAWSVLYYRYVRVDLNLSVEDLERVSQQTKRTLHRRQSRGINRLTHVLAYREAKTRARRSKATLRSQLPRPYPPVLIGRDSLVEQAIQRLSAENVPRHLVVYGAPGIGKSTVALAVAHRLIEAQPLQSIAWVQQADSQGDDLLEQIALQIGIPLTLDNRPALATYLQVMDTLIVLDHMTLDGAVDQILKTLGAARLLICAVQSPNALVDIDLARLYVPELDKAAALEFLEKEASKRGKSYKVEYLAGLYDDFGGNPGALSMAMSSGRHYSPGLISADLYRHIWDAVSRLAHLVWLIVSFSPAMSTQYDKLRLILPHVEPMELDSALGELVDAAALEAGPETLALIALTPLAQSFARHVVQDQPLRELVEAAVSAVADYLSIEPVTVECLFLLSSAQRANLRTSLLLDLAYAFAPVVEQAGAWSMWSSFLQALQDVTRDKDRLWVQLRLGIAQRWLGQSSEAAYLLAEVMKAAGQTGAFDIQADAMTELAAVYRQQRQRELADQLLRRASSYYVRSKHAYGLERVTAEYVQIALDAGDVPAAQQYLHELDEQITGQSPRLLSLAALVALHADEPDRALHFAQTAQQRLGDDLPRLARTVALLGQIYYRLGDRVAAINHMASALSMMEQTHDLIGHARTSINLAAIYLVQGNLRTTLRYLRDLPAELERLGDVDSLQATLKNLEMLNRVSRHWTNHPPQ